ncbi:MAG TPA: hypothetical protein VIX14_07100 [Terriglobales bacterium]
MTLPRLYRASKASFEVTSLTGERYFVTCQPGHSISSIEWAGSEPNLQPFLVRKVAPPVTSEGRTKRSAAA